MAIAKATKEQLLHHVTARRKSLYEAKMQRFEMRIQVEELRSTGVSWVKVLSFTGYATILFMHFYGHKQLKLRAQLVLKHLLLLSMSLGRILRNLWRIRRKHAICTLRSIVPFAGMWMTRKKRVFRESIAHTFEVAITQELIYKLHRRWMRSILLVQRHVRHFVACRRVMYSTFVMVWLEMEKKMHRRPSKSRPEVDVTWLLVPDRIRERYLRLAVKRKCIAYFKSMAEYEKECLRLTAKHQEDSLNLAVKAIVTGSKVTTPRLELPQAPVMQLFLDKKTIESLILDANAHRFQWESRT